MNAYHYPVRTLVSDYIRSGLGVFLPIALMLFTDLSPLVTYILSALVLLFGIYGLRTVLRQATVLTVDGDGMRQEGPLGGLLNREIHWADMRDFRLRYYSTRRDGREGWMQLVLRSAKGTASRGPIRMDSHLPEFNDIAQRVYNEAREYGLVIDRTSAANLSAAGIEAEFGNEFGSDPVNSPSDQVRPS